MKNILPVIFAFILLVGCKKDVESLPDPTQTGANTFGAKVDGAFWVPQRFTSVGSSTILEARMTGTGTLIINARNFSSSPTETEFEILIRNMTGPGTYPLDQLTAKQPGESASYGYYIQRKFMPEHEWITNAAHTGSVTITKYDPANRIVSGTFAFNAATTDGSANPISVTEGRFDITFSN